MISCDQNRLNPPNIILILVDDLGIKDLGCYGQKFIQTPNIDKFASQGMRWTNAYSSAPVCSPTRVAILSGKNPARIHFTGHITSIGRHRHPPNSRIIPPADLMDIPLEEEILPEVLKSLGYQSISIGKWHVGRKGFWPTDMGFDKNIGGWTHGSPPSHFYPYERPGSKWNASIPTLKGGHEGEYLADRLTIEAMKFMEDSFSRPFFVYLSFYAVHKPLQAPQDLIKKYQGILPDDKLNPVYAAMVENLDLNIGRLLQFLEKNNLSGNTIVIFASDNGGLAQVTDNSPYRSGKGYLYEGGIRVPLLIRWPGHILPGTVSTNLTITEDIFTTIVDIATSGKRDFTHLDGRSLREDFDEQVNNEVELHWYYPHYSPQGNRPGAAIRSGSFKLIEFYDPESVELYDLSTDQGEKTDLSDKMPLKVKELNRHLHQWLDSVDPIRHSVNPNYKKNSFKRVE
jgi:arylsulfatase A-like enzyme